MSDEEKKEVENLSTEVSKMTVGKNGTVSAQNHNVECSSGASVEVEEKNTHETPQTQISSNEASSCSSGMNKKNSVKKNESSKEKQTMEFLLNEFCDELEHQLLGIKTSMQHHARVQCRVDKKLRAHSGELVLLNSKSIELRQKIALMQRIRIKALARVSKDPKDIKDKVEKQTLPQLKLRKRALEQLMAKVNDRIKTVKSISNTPPQDNKKIVLAVKAKESTTTVNKKSSVPKTKV